MKFILITLLALAGWQQYQKSINTSISERIEPQTKQRIEPAHFSPRYRDASVSRDSSQPHFSCDKRQHCSQMNSRVEAEFFTLNCPGAKMDGDHDGIPCENDSRF